MPNVTIKRAYYAVLTTADFPDPVALSVPVKCSMAQLQLAHEIMTGIILLKWKGI